MPEPDEREPFLPKISLRVLIGLVTMSAVAMGIVQQAIATGATWAVLATVLIASLLVPVLFYVGTFSLASLFSTIGSAAMGFEPPQPIYSPTTEMPAAIAPQGSTPDESGRDEPGRGTGDPPTETIDRIDTDPQMTDGQAP